jgi:predicted nucleic acid-binding protein
VGFLLDAYALVAFLEDDPRRWRSTVCSAQAAADDRDLAEAGQRVLRHSDVTAAGLRELVSSLPLAVVPFTEVHGWRAAELRARYYRRADSAVSLADCCLVAVATTADRVATADPAVIRMATAEGVGLLELTRP